MKELGKGKKIWTGMFLSYMLIILLCFFLYSGMIAFETYTLGRERTERENQVQVQELGNLIESRLIAAKSVASRINSSSAVRRLYMSVIDDGQVLNSYTLYSVLNDMRQVQASVNRLDMSEAAVFIDGYNHGYSYTGVINLDEPFDSEALLYPAVSVASVSEKLGIDANGKLLLSRTGLLYTDNYTYGGGSSRGRIAVVFDLETLEREIASTIRDDSGWRILFDGREIISGGDVSGEAASIASSSTRGVTTEVYFHRAFIPTGTMQALILLLLCGAVLTITFIALAYYFSRKYYKPIEHIGQLVIDAPSPQNYSEMTTIISGIRDLIGERNGYREKMVTIAPYAQQGMLHGVLSGNIKNDAVQILQSETYLDLQKPYFIISAVNIVWPKTCDDKIFGTRVQDTSEKLRNIFSTDECKIYTYRRDLHNLFLIVNNDFGKEMDELFFQMHKFLTQSMNEPNCLVTMGIDSVKDDINELHTACTCALQALDNMLICGRGEVYFYENDDADEQRAYYFPKNCEMRISKYIRERRLADIKSLLDDIYKKNVTRNKMTTSAVHALVDELHITTVKCVKELSELNTTHINVEKPSEVATLDEIFAYYYAVYEALLTALGSAEETDSTDTTLSASILKFVEENYCMPEMSLQFLTDKFGVSSKYISIIFKKQLDTTYLQYLHEKRIHRAMELLQTSEYSLEQVGEMCGYTNQLTFRRNFKTYAGVTPSEYRTATPDTTSSK